MIMGDIITGFATAFGLGNSPVLPGTVGALPGLGLAWLVVRRSRRVQLWSAAILIVVAVPVCEVASNTLGGKDDSRIVADEFMVFPAAVAGQTIARQPLVLAGVFLASRVLDGAKPPPAARVESEAGGLGIVLDDLVVNAYIWLLLAGSYAAYRRWRHFKEQRT